MKPGANFVGVLGWPLEVTWSPVIHNVAFRHLQLDWVYLRWPVPPDELGDAVRGLRALRAAGANVTMPHKRAIVEHLDDITGDARAIDAVNTVQRVGDRLVGHNTDVGGFAEFLVGDAGFDAKGTSALVLGAGGAAKAVVKALADLQVAEVTVAARRSDAAATVAELASGSPGSTSAVVGWGDASTCASEVDLVVNATPIGMHGERLLKESTFNPDQYVVDLVSSPPSTPLVEQARSHGASAWGGVGMLIRQAAASFEIWTGQQAPIQAMSAAAIRAIGHHR
ncbi:MAG: shikimate dehydrogenase [Actinomycetota bacterium]